MSSGAKIFKKNGNIFTLFKGIFISLIISVIGILVFAVVLKFVDLSDTIIKIVNQVIKVLSVFWGIKTGLRNFDKRSFSCLFCGLAIGIIYTFLSYLTFSLFVSSFNFGISFFLDCVFAGGVGVVFSFLK